MLVRGPVDVLELRVAVRMRGAFLPFARRLQPVAQAVQQPAHSGRTHPPSLLGQRRRQLRPTLARPAQRRGRVAAGERIHQRFERGLDAGLVLLDAGPSAPRASDAVRRRLVAGNLPASLANRLPSQTGGRRNHRVAAVAIASDSAAAHRRRLRSSNTGTTTAYFATRVASSSMSRFIPPVWPENQQVAN